MAKYIAQRLIVMFFILLGVLTITFVLSRALPGSPVEMMLGNHPTVEQIAVAREKLGLESLCRSNTSITSAIFSEVILALVCAPGGR